MSQITANRVAAVAAFCTGLAAAVLAITQTFPTAWQQTVVALAGIIGAIGTALHFMLGSQKFDQTTAGQAKALAQLPEAIRPADPVAVAARAAVPPRPVVPDASDPAQWLANRVSPPQ